MVFVTSTMHVFHRGLLAIHMKRGYLIVKQKFPTLWLYATCRTILISTFSDAYWTIWTQLVPFTSWALPDAAGLIMPPWPTAQKEPGGKKQDWLRTNVIIYLQQKPRARHRLRYGRWFRLLDTSSSNISLGLWAHTALNPLTSLKIICFGT